MLTATRFIDLRIQRFVRKIIEAEQVSLWEALSQDFFMNGYKCFANVIEK
ncbi:hypothetical protein DES37_12050 [Mangrovibacter plantisponsor]|uniref:Uncharacterized protein n=1 Tax=Mangrovibacter plantisponsor TaxID=451513 RepID=A0A317PQW6_9ENTR|nr:hypothetical protein DES37_12050 [Mangrovibacter plantisponsor]